MTYEALGSEGSPVSLAELRGNLPEQFAFESLPMSSFAELHGSFTMRNMMESLRPSQGGNVLEPSVYIVAGVVKGIIEQAGEEDIVQLNNQATRLALQLFAGVDSSAAHDSLVEMLDRAGLMDRQVELDFDESTAFATLPALSDATAARINTRVNEPLLMLPVCNGGFVASTMTALYMLRRDPETDAILYPIRFSFNKMQEGRPKINGSEYEYLRAIAPDRTILLCDDDVTSGGTLGYGARAIAQDFPSNTVLATANNISDFYERNAETMFGVWFEHDWQSYKPS